MEIVIYMLMFLVLITFIGVIGYYYIYVYGDSTNKINITSISNTNFEDINNDLDSTLNNIGVLDINSSNINSSNINRRNINSSNINVLREAIDNKNIFDNTVKDKNTSNLNIFGYNLNNYFTFKEGDDQFNSTTKKIYEYKTFDDHISQLKLELQTKTTALSGFQLNTNVDKVLGICNADGSKCFQVLSTDDNLSIYKPTNQKGNNDIYIGGNDATAPIKIVNGEVYIQGVKYIPGTSATSATSATKKTANASAIVTMGPEYPIINVTNGGSGYYTPPKVVFNNDVVPTGGTKAKAGVVLGTGDNSDKVSKIIYVIYGTGYTGAPTISFTDGIALPGKNIVKPTAISTTYRPMIISSINITDKGAGYTRAPEVFINNNEKPSNGHLARAKAILGTTTGFTDKVDSIIIEDPGSGYINPPSITFTSPERSDTDADAREAARSATYSAWADAILVSDVKIDINITGGSGYATPPTVVFNDGVVPTDGTIATGTVVMGTGNNADKVDKIIITSYGSGYTSAPIISFTGGTAVPGKTIVKPVATIVDSVSKILTEIRITYPGSGYKREPEVVINNGEVPINGSLARAKAVLGTAIGFTDKVVDIILEDAGSGYTSVPTITFKNK